MNDKFKTTGFLFDKIKRLYPTFVKPDELDIEVWTEILEGYSQTDILEALKAYRKETPYDRAPNPATFKTFLHGVEKTNSSRVSEILPISHAIQKMSSDIESGNCHHLLPVYEEAVKYILTDKLIEAIGASEYSKLSYGQKYQTAVKNGLFNDFDTTLKKVCFMLNGKEEQFQSENDLINARGAHFDLNDKIGSLASHWRV